MANRFLLMTGCVLTASSVIAQVKPSAQPPRSSSEARAENTIVEFELLSPSSVGGSLQALDWMQALEKVGASGRVRQSTADDKPGVTEKIRGTLKWVKVVGELEADGRLVLPDQQFALADTARLQEWINELKLYGAQGAPAGKPLWGLSDAQFNELFAALGQPITRDSYGKTLDEALEQLGLPDKHPLRFHSTAAKHMSQQDPVKPVRQHLAQLSCGTGLAALLADQGLGFRPLRTPAGEIELVIQPLSDIHDSWPVGWEPQKEQQRRELAPGLFKMAPVKFDGIPLQDVLDDIAQTSGTPILVDHYAVEQKGVNLAETTLSYPLKRVAWMQVINSVTARNHMTHELRVDEAGRPFVHVKPFVPGRLTD